MRNKIQKYLSGNQEGFSLVELIIVIAIMAILIGVVALAVLPYLEKSRESKDLSTLDTICSALVSAVAETQTSTADSFVYSSATGDVKEAMSGVIGSANTEFKSNSLAGVSSKVFCFFDPASNKAAAYASKDTNGASVTTLRRTTTNVSSSDAGKIKPGGTAITTTPGKGAKAGVTNDWEHAAIVMN